MARAFVAVCLVFYLSLLVVVYLTLCPLLVIVQAKGLLGLAACFLAPSLVTKKAKKEQ